MKAKSKAKKVAPEKEGAALTATARNAIVTSFVSALTANESTGSLVTQVCEIAAKHLKGAPIPETDRTSITAEIAKQRGWKGRTRDSRISECNVILRAYAKLPEAVEAFASANKTCQWHDAMFIARRLNKGDSQKDAVNAARKRGEGAPKGNPAGRLAGALVGIMAHVRGDKRKAVIAATRELLKAKVITFKGKNAEKFLA